MMLPLGLYLLGLIVIVITHWTYKWKNPRCNGRLPPGSMGLPLIGESFQFITPSNSIDIPHFVKSRIHKYGRIFKTSLVGRAMVVSSDVEFNHFILQQEGRLVELWYLDSFAKLLGHEKGSKKEGSTNSHGHIHRYLRSLVLSQFGHDVLKHTLLSQLQDISIKSLHTWLAAPQPLEIKHAFSVMIFDATAKQMFGYEPKEHEENLGVNFTNFLQGLMSFPLNIPGTAFHRCVQNQKKAMKMIKKMITERKASPEKRRGDLLDQVLDDMKKEAFLTHDFVTVVMFGLLLASFETISSTLTLAIILLTDHPSVVQQLEEENEEILEKRGSSKETRLTWKEYKSMTFTHQVINEVLRMASVAPGIIRKVIKDIHVNGYTIPEGWTIMVVPSAIQLNPDTYEDPLTFNPWRWKDVGAISTAKNFIPFGGGSRACAGAEFSRVLMAVFLHVFVTNYRWNKVKGGEVARSPVLGFGNGYFIKLFEKLK
ncbi:beta-amyrin 16-alpha-hydroxylase CYP87D16-like [Malania oleifera]|uniref:beta-amyrin 16-alpha-hydroxylase CYP87D16-like n=1 Tax=Malania oleifera TaxID=397392 RepID=UPI0025AE1F60|nr:beta-amyrin 16-alpha-hydroxylase CYP87D16-like [Malania oleifera]